MENNPIIVSRESPPQTATAAAHTALRGAASRDAASCARRPIIPFFSLHRDPFVSHVLSWLEDLLCVSFRLANKPPDELTGGVIYGVRSSNPSCIAIPRRQYDESPPPLLEDFFRVDAEDLAGRFPFDFFQAIHYWMTDRPHANMHIADFDAHGRLPYEKSIFSRLKTPAEPIVNRYILLFRSMLERMLQREMPSLWPQGKKACIVLTHDVDDPLDPASLHTALHSARLMAQTESPDWTRRLFFRNAFQALRSRMSHSHGKNRHWLFDEIIDSETRLGFRSTFFFATRDRHAIRANRDFDVTYSTRDKRFKRIFETLRKDGFEIGLHASYNAHGNVDLLEEEKRTLETQTHGPIIGNRHHYWHTGYPVWNALDNHTSTGLRYDSSLAFNEEPGYRFGIGLPFLPWNPTSQKPIPVIQIPPVLMDGAIFYKPASLDQGLATIDRLLDSLITHEAVGAIDWHVRTSFPANRKFRVWGECYQELLRLLSHRSDIWVTSCEGLLAHLDQRGDQP